MQQRRRCGTESSLAAYKTNNYQGLLVQHSLSLIYNDKQEFIILQCYDRHQQRQQQQDTNGAAFLNSQNAPAAPLYVSNPSLQIDRRQ
jgi:hypothetical protein